GAATGARYLGAALDDSLLKGGSRVACSGTSREGPARNQSRGEFEPMLAEALRGGHAAVLPGCHLNKRHWNTVIIDGSLSDDAVRAMIEDSYDLVVSKLPEARRRALGWRSD